MKYHEIDCVGPIFVERLTVLPANSADNKGRYVVIDGNKSYYGGDTTWKLIQTVSDEYDRTYYETFDTVTSPTSTGFIADKTWTISRTVGTDPTISYENGSLNVATNDINAILSVSSINDTFVPFTNKQLYIKYDATLSNPVGTDHKSMAYFFIVTHETLDVGSASKSVIVAFFYSTLTQNSLGTNPVKLGTVDQLTSSSDGATVIDLSSCDLYPYLSQFDVQFVTSDASGVEISCTIDYISLESTGNVDGDLAAHVLSTNHPTVSTSSKGFIPALPTVDAATKFFNGLGEYVVVDTDTTSSKITVTQASHGFHCGSIIRMLNDGTYTSASSTSAANAEAIGMVINIISNNSFSFITNGYFDVTDYAQTLTPSLTPGAVHFLSATTGLFTDVEPTTAGYISKPLIVAEGTNSGYFFNWRGSIVVDATTTTTVIGTVIAWPGPTVPDGYLECGGQVALIATYPNLYAALGSGAIYGQSGGYFNLPDYRGWFLRGKDDGGGVDTDRLTRSGGANVGSSQQDEFESHAHGIGIWTVGTGAGPGSFVTSPAEGYQTTSRGGSTETRPKNKYVIYCIKY